MFLLRAFRRRRLAKRPVPPAWEQILAERLPWSTALTAEHAVEFRRHLMAFALEKRFLGLKGLEVTDEMRVIVAASAARLSLHLDLDVWDGLGSVLLVSGAVAQHTAEDGTQGRVLGLAHEIGTITLSWDAVRHGVSIPTDGHDTALHELAHMLDIDDGAFDGTPELERASDARAWGRVLSRHYLSLKARPDRRVLRAYGATNEAEFFAVATEAFFEKPAQLKKKKPDLYETLADFYKTRPAG